MQYKNRATNWANSGNTTIESTCFEDLSHQIYKHFQMQNQREISDINFVLSEFLLFWQLSQTFFGIYLMHVETHIGGKMSSIKSVVSTVQGDWNLRCK